jgi:transketolase
MFRKKLLNFIKMHSSSNELASFVRKNVIQMTHDGNSSHIGSCLSIVDILSVLYFDFLKTFPKDPTNNDRDWFILSKGHAGAAIYATLSGMGYFEKSFLKQHYQNGSIMSGHVSHKSIPGVEFSTGSLGHGLPVACGVAHGFKIDKKNNRVVCLLSDGECDEGSNWESILYAGHFCLDNLTVIVDYNKIQSLDSTENTIALEPFADKWKSFKWNVIECDGHNHEEILSALNSNTKLPKVIIANTIKGKGVSFMENKVLWHYRSPQGDEFESAMEEVQSNEE